MLEIALGSITFSMVGCMVLVAVMLAEKFELNKSFRYDGEPEYKIARHHVQPPIFIKPKATKKKKTNGVQTPSKHMTLAQLEKIKADNYCGETHEYFAEEIEAAIIARSESRADRMVSEAIKRLDPISAVNF